MSFVQLVPGHGTRSRTTKWMRKVLLRTPVLLPDIGRASLTLPGTPSPQPYPTCQDGILEGGPRDRVWTTGPYPSCKVVALGALGHFTRRKKKVEVRGIGRFAELATPTFLI